MAMQWISVKTIYYTIHHLEIFAMDSKNFLFYQVPIYEQRNDGRDNLLGALVITGHYIIPEVCFYFPPL